VLATKGNQFAHWFIRGWQGRTHYRQSYKLGQGSKNRINTFFWSRKRSFEGEKGLNKVLWCGRLITNSWYNLKVSWIFDVSREPNRWEDKETAYRKRGSKKTKILLAPKHLSHKLSLLASVTKLCVHALWELSVKGSERETCQNPTQTQVGSDICSWNISGSFERSLLAAFIEQRLIVSRWRSRSCAEKIT
jgi:hypothetical protein